MRYSNIATSLSFLSAFLVSIISSTELANRSPTQQSNCKCDCDCAYKAEKSCELDVIVLLDAASCVKNSWHEMKLRVELLSRIIENKYSMGGTARFAVFRFAQSATRDILLDENLGSSDFVKRMNDLTWVNEGSFLDRGLNEVERYLNEEELKNHDSARKKMVILVTSGNSHPDAKPTGAQIKRISNLVNGELYVNTLVPIHRNEFDAPCDACKYNEKLFINEGRMDFDRQIISKDELPDRFQKLIGDHCQDDSASLSVCNNCICTCESLTGDSGEKGPRGDQGEIGFSGAQGLDGHQGLDGFVGIDGPDGPVGCDAFDGHPGRHGRPGKVGATGERGLAGVIGLRGPEGPEGAINGEQGKPGADGFPGPIGSPGITGCDGVNGKTGKPGVTGAEGDDGEPGDRGLRGYCGHRGKDGEVGAPGFKGVNGERGFDGKKGRPGPSGLKGEPGFAGARGIQGEQGYCGEVGKPGLKGVVGMPGPTGVRGGVTGKSQIEVQNDIRKFTRNVLDKLLPADGGLRICGSESCDRVENLILEYFSRMEIGEEIHDLSEPVEGRPVTFPTEIDMMTDNVLDNYENFDENYDDTTILINAVRGDKQDYDQSNDLDTDEGFSQNFDQGEVPIETPQKTTVSTSRDLVFLVELSNVIQVSEWQLVSAWIERLITVSNQKTESVVIVARFDPPRNPTMQAILERNIESLKLSLKSENVIKHVTTDSFELLKYCSDVVFPNLRNSANKVLITITDEAYRDVGEKSNEEKADILAEIHSKFPVMIAVGVGPEPSVESLAPWATDEGKSFEMASFEQLEDVTEMVIREIN